MSQDLRAEVEVCDLCFVCASRTEQYYRNGINNAACAALYGHIDCLRQSVNELDSQNRLDDYCFELLMQEAISGDNVACLHLLREIALERNYWNEVDIYELLVDACAFECVEAMVLLKQWGAEPGEIAESLLDLCTHHDNVEIADLLIAWEVVSRDDVFFASSIDGALRIARVMHDRGVSDRIFDDALQQWSSETEDFLQSSEWLMNSELEPDESLVREIERYHAISWFDRDWHPAYCYKHDDPSRPPRWLNFVSRGYAFAGWIRERMTVGSQT